VTVLRCKDCKKEFPITEEDELVPLQKLIEQGKVDGGHLWYRGRKYDLRHRSYSDILEEQADREICSICGVPHDSNPTTGCELKEA